MYAIEVRDRIMIAHSLPDPFFGPAQAVHGATFIVDVAFFRETLTPKNVVIDIGIALTTLKEVLQDLDYKNLDDMEQFSSVLTTTEFLAKHIFGRMADAARSGRLGVDGRGLSKIRVTLHESDVARASFEGSLGG